jgi:hypothetical protein
MPPHPERSPSDWQFRPLAAALITAGMLAPAGVAAATLTVDTLAEASGSACTLRDAVHSVNALADQGACAADLGGGGYGTNDAIVFAPALSGTITFATSDPLALVGPSALSLQRPVSLIGPGSAQMLLTCGSTSYRLMEIASTPPVAVSGLTIAGCVSSDEGAGMLVTDKFTGNVAPIVQLADVVVHDNHMVGSSFNVGGGIAVAPANVGATLSLTRSSVSLNSSIGNGGGIGIHPAGGAPATVTVSDSALSLNSARNGGGVAVQGVGSSIQLTRSTLDHNAATTDGGGILAQAGVATVRDTTISGNQASGRGGGVAVQFSPAGFMAVNSTISNNAANLGGGIDALHTGAGAIVLRNSTVAANGALRGSGIMVENALASALLTPANVVAINTIVAGNILKSVAPDVDSLQPDTWDVSFSVVGGIGPAVTLTGSGNLTGLAVPPPFGAGGWLGPLQNNGGTTMTHELLTSVADPAINAGDPSFSGLAFDQRGSPFTRVREGRVDIGAFESGALTVAAPAPVPGPAGWALGGLSAVLGLAGMLFWRRRDGR